jgi:hypothetical protein
MKIIQSICSSSIEGTKKIESIRSSTIDDLTLLALLEGEWSNLCKRCCGESQSVIYVPSITDLSKGSLWL